MHHWMIVARRTVPTSDRIFLRQVYSLGIGTSAEQMIERARLKAGMDRDFRKLFAGWTLCPMIVDYNVQILENESVVLYKNEKESDEHGDPSATPPIRLFL